MIEYNDIGIIGLYDEKSVLRKRILIKKII